MKSSLALALSLTAFATPALQAVQINLTYVTNGQMGSIPNTDAQGTRLMAVAEAAAAHWENIIEDNHTLDILVRYDNSIGAGTIGLWTIDNESNGRADDGIIGVRGNINWYYDTTPTDHSEYQLTDNLFRNASNANAANFTGTVPGVLEIGFRGPLPPDPPPLQIAVTVRHQSQAAPPTKGRFSPGHHQSPLPKSSAVPQVKRLFPDS